MSRGPASRIRAGLALACAGLAAGCGAQTATVAVTRPPAVTASLSTSLTTAQGTWAIAVMGGSAASHDNFWQLFVRRANTGRWSLVTPEGVADNGGLVAAGGNGSLVVGFRPSQELAYSPLATSTDAGLNWTPGLLDAALADTPGAIAVGPVGAHPRAAAGRHDRGGADGGRRGRRAVGAAGHAHGAGGVRPGSLLRPGGHDRRLVRPRSEPDRGGKLRAAGCGRGLHRRRRDLAVGGTDAARERPGNGYGAGARPDRHPGRQRGAAGHGGQPARGLVGRDALDGIGPGDGGRRAGARVRARRKRVAAAGRRAGRDHRRGAGSTWRALPPVPAGTTVLAPPGTGTLAPGTGGSYDALAVAGSRLTVWRLARGAWGKVQQISVPVQYGSSG